MPSPKSGSPGTLVPPTAPDAALDADDADPGVVEQTKAAQRETQTGKYGAQQATPFTPEAPADDAADAPATTSGAAAGSDTPPPQTETSWIEIKLLDEEGHPVPGESYQITLPDGSVASSTTNDKGLARVEGFAPGQCKVSFPNLDTTVWEDQ